jgi:hypothetical protein
MSGQLIQKQPDNNSSKINNSKVNNSKVTSNNIEKIFKLTPILHINSDPAKKRTFKKNIERDFVKGIETIYNNSEFTTNNYGSSKLVEVILYDKEDNNVRLISNELKYPGQEIHQNRILFEDPEIIPTNNNNKIKFSLYNFNFNKKIIITIKKQYLAVDILNFSIYIFNHSESEFTFYYEEEEQNDV